MGNKLYIGGVAYATSEETLKDLFENVGNVVSVRVIMDRDTGRSKGFAFVEMSSEDEANEAIEKYNGTELDGRRLLVAEAKPQAPRENRPSRDSYGNNDRGGYNSNPNANRRW